MMVLDFTNHPTNTFSQLDVDSKEEYQTWYATLRGKIRQCLVEITAFLPQVTLQASFEKLQAVLPKSAPDSTREAVNSAGHCSVMSMTFLEWENASSIFEWVVNSLKDDVKKSTAVVQNMHSLFTALLNFSTDDPLIQTRYLHIIGYLRPLYDSDANALNLALQKVTNILEFWRQCASLLTLHSVLNL